MKTYLESFEVKYIDDTGFLSRLPDGRRSFGFIMWFAEKYLNRSEYN